MSKVLLFKNLFSGKEDNGWINQATLLLASCLDDVMLSGYRFEDGAEGKDKLLGLLPKVDIVVITLLEGCFHQTLDLMRFVREKSDAFIIVGGIMPTLTPDHVMEHTIADAVVRGDGEKALFELVSIIDKMRRVDGGKSSDKGSLVEKSIHSLESMKGVIFRHKGRIIRSREGINVSDLEDIRIDFGLLEKENVAEGFNLSTSRGCFNNCLFCTMPMKGRYRAMSLGKLKGILKGYEARLVELFGDNIPSKAFQLSFHDDDFMADPKRAMEVLKYIGSTRFKINFIQASVRSFFDGSSIRQDLIDSLDGDTFVSQGRSLYLGTENFCDEELNRLGKGYGFDKVIALVEALDKRGIRQSHHLIMTNSHTTLDNILENLFKIEMLNKFKTFEVLTPVISHLVSFYPSMMYSLQEKRGVLNVEVDWLRSGRSEFDYPLVKKDIPFDKDVRDIADRADRFFKGGRPIEKVMVYLLKRSEREKISGKISSIGVVLEKYHDYARKLGLKGKKNNLQIMLTRRCHLRCSYCPIPKKDKDMELMTLRQAIDMLVGGDLSPRIDFTGGEPLLRFDLMRQGMDYALSKRKDVSFYIVTNAIALGKKERRYLEGKDVLLELSIDGDESLHNKYKIPVDDINPYRLTTKNALSLDIGCFVVIVTTPEDVATLCESVDHIVSLGFNRFDINYAIGCMWDQASVKIFFSEMDKIMSRYDDKIRRNEIIIGNISKRSEPAVLNAEFMVDVDGTIRPLNEFLFRSADPKKPPYDFGKVGETDMTSLYMDRFMVYYSLIKMYPEQRRIIDNNIEMGLISKRYFSRWR